MINNGWRSLHVTSYSPGKRLGRWALENEDLCRKRVHWLAILIQSSAFDFNDGLVWLGPGGQNLDDLAFHAQTEPAARSYCSI
jgi:hypothetical protein